MRHIALVGNPNVGKSTIFNSLTGLRQHTGNWPGKTVDIATGHYTYKGREYELIDLPGTYSPYGLSSEEEITGDFIRSRRADGIVVICDGTCLERSLLLALQVIRLSTKVLVAVNLLDEAERMGLSIDISGLSSALGVPVLGICGKNKEDLKRLQEQLRLLTEGFLPYDPPQREDHEGDISYAETICARVCHIHDCGQSLTEKLDRILIHSFWAYPCIFLLLLLILWLTIRGANYPSGVLQTAFLIGGDGLRSLMAGLPPWLGEGFIEGLYEPVTRVISVMLPPMAIFFPLFTLLEDFGYLPRIAFLLDEGFRRCGGCGKQALTMSMGFGCNAVGVTGCRIMDSPENRLMGILTNALVPCNGRFPALILLMGVVLGNVTPAMQALGLTVAIGLSVFMTLLASRFLNRHVTKGEQSFFVMEMPPYRRPKIGQVLIRSIPERCLSILGRAVTVAAPMGLLLWSLRQIPMGEGDVITALCDLLEIPGGILGMGGTMLLAFILGSPANELVIPIGIMLMTGGQWSTGEAEVTAQTLCSLGFSAREGLCTMIFMLFHWPCTTTLWTIYKETKSYAYTFLAWLLPTGIGAVLCMGINLLFR